MYSSQTFSKPNSIPDQYLRTFGTALEIYCGLYTVLLYRLNYEMQPRNTKSLSSII